MRALAATLALTTGCAALRTMDRTDLALEGLHAAATAVDAMTTRNITRQCQELNPVIGPCGRGMPIPLYFGSFLVLHLALTLTLPEGKARTAFQAITLGTEGHATYNNLVSGWGLR